MNRWLGIALHCLRLVAVFVLLSASPVVARSVFVVYDTSGSMQDRRYLPAFGTAMLAATLDGRPGRDRLYVMSFADYRSALGEIGAVDGIALSPENVRKVMGQLPRPPYRQETMTDRTLQARAVADMNKRLVQLRGGTPYGPIEAMLDAIAQLTTEGEEAHLIVVTDGEFNPEGRPKPGAVMDSFRQHAARIKADLSVSFLLILPSNSRSGAEKLRKDIRDQNIRSSLLQVFNGDPDRGSYEVDSGDALWNALRTIIADIAATDRTELGRYVAYDGNQIRIDTPFSITRIISVATNASGTPPRLQQTSFSGTPEDIAVKMLGQDEEFPGLAFQGTTSQIRFTPGLPPGVHSLTYDAPVESGVFLLFDTNVVASIELIDPLTGQPAPRDSAGYAILETGRTYRTEVSLSDPGSTVTTEFSRLSPTTEFSLEQTGPTGSAVLSLQRDDATNRATLSSEWPQTGTYSLSAQVRIPGFVSPRSAPLGVRVLSRRLDLALIEEIPGQSCSGCAPGELVSSITAADQGATVATYRVSVGGDLAGTIRIDLSASSDSVVLTDGTGARLLPGQEMSAQPGEVLEFVVRRDSITDGSLASLADGMSFRLAVTPTQGAELAFDRKVRLDVPAVRVDLVGFSKGDPARGPLDLTGAELRDRAGHADLVITGAVLEPGHARITVEPANRGLFWSLRTVVDDFTIRTTPQSPLVALFWLEAGSAIMGRDFAATVIYEDALGLQRAETQVPMTFTVSWGDFFLSLALNLAILLLALYLLLVFFALLNVRRFPPHSVAETRFPQDESVRRRPLRGSWLIYLGILLAPIRGAPQEKASIEDLQLVAAPNGARVVFPRTGAPRWYVKSRGQTFQQIRALSPSLTSFNLRWGETLLQEDDHRHTLTLVKDRRNAG
jgi:hypothetical protein